jgi:hypothetical protein
VILQRFPIMLHQVYSILMGKRKEVQILFLMKLIPLVEYIIAYFTVPVEIGTDNVGVAIAEALQNILV